MDVVIEYAKNSRLLHKIAHGFMKMEPSAWLKLGVFMAAALVVDQLGLDGQRFYHVSPHPFWIIVLLLAAQYGVLAGVVASVASSMVYLIANPALPMGTLLAPDTFYLPTLWVLAALTLGEIRQRHINAAETLREQLEESVARESVTAQAYQEVRGRKQSLEERVAGDMRSALTVYQAAKAMETMSSAQLMRSIETVVRELTDAKSFSLFLLDAQGLHAVITLGWGDLNTQLAQRIPVQAALYTMIVERRELLTIANEAHSAALAGEGVMAAPVIARTGEVLGMLKIESLPFYYLGVQAVETLRAVADWTAQALINAQQFEHAVSNAVVDPRNHLMTRAYFERHTRYLKALGQRAKFPVSLLTVSLEAAETMAEDVQIKLARTVRDAVKDSLRSVDLAFDYHQTGLQYSVVLPTTDSQGAEIVRSKLASSLEHKLGVQSLHCPFTTSVQTLVT